MVISEILELDRLAKESVERYTVRRPLYQELAGKRGKQFFGVIGPRGAGKTVLLQQLAHNTASSIYISVDAFQDLPLFDTAKELQTRFGIQTLFLDEIHYRKDFSIELKKIYDFLDMHIIFTSSIALALEQLSVDLSRRVRLLPLPLFSFREYIGFSTGTFLPALPIDRIFSGTVEQTYLSYESQFASYLHGGILPFSLNDPDPLPLLANILKTVIRSDIPKVHRLAVDELDTLERIVRFIGRSSVDGINYSSVAKNIGITKYKAISYLGLLDRALVLHLLMPKGANVSKEPKVLLRTPYRLLFREYDECIGGLREDFVVDMLAATNLPLYYLKSTRGKKTPDFLLEFEDEEVVIEVGGKAKGRSQFKGISTKTKIIFSQTPSPTKAQRPLSLLGMMY